MEILNLNSWSMLEPLMENNWGIDMKKVVSQEILILRFLIEEAVKSCANGHGKSSKSMLKVVS